MRPSLLRLIFALASLASASLAAAQGTNPTSRALPIFDLPLTGVEFVTGDTWRVNEQTIRLYGVQSCIRGTTFTNPKGERADCGEASLAYAVAIIRDTHPRCTAIARGTNPDLVFSVCAAHVGKNTLDLGTILITEGFAFAATDVDGKAINFTYAVVEGEAQKARRGLWASPDLPYPNRILINAAHAPRSQ